MALSNRLAQKKQQSTKNEEKKEFRFDKSTVTNVSPIKQRSSTSKNYTRKFKPSER